VVNFAHDERNVYKELLCSYHSPITGIHINKAVCTPAAIESHVLLLSAILLHTFSIISISLQQMGQHTVAHRRILSCVALRCVPVRIARLLQSLEIPWAGCRSCRSTNSVKILKGTQCIDTQLEKITHRSRLVPIRATLTPAERSLEVAHPLRRLSVVRAVSYVHIHTVKS